ncbi:MAG: AI-2E family transporter [Deltaproteobacteria bacterium]|nr:AI-2E family transporter [Deltaproteobacteria bacterium]
MSTDQTITDSFPPHGPGSRKRRFYFLGASGFLLLVVLVYLREVLLPFALAIVVAYVLSPAVAACEKIKIGKKRAPRWFVVLLVYLVLLGVLSGLTSLSVPLLAAEITKLTREAPRAVGVVRDEWLPQIDKWLRDATALYTDPYGGEKPLQQTSKPQIETPSRAIRVEPRADGGGYEIILPDKGIAIRSEGENTFLVGGKSPNGNDKVDITEAITDTLTLTAENTERTTVTLLQTAQKVIKALTSGIFTFFLTLMISAYLMITSDRIFGFFRSLYIPSKRFEFDELVRRIDRGLAGVVRGQLVICLVNGVLTGIGFYFLGVRYWFFLTLVAAVMSIIPIFGAILSSIPAVIVAISDDYVLALLVLGWVIVIHQIEANLLNPKIMGDAARVHPVMVIFALLAGEHVGGIVGALLAVPVLSILQSLFLFMREHALGVPRATSTPPSE